MLLKTTMAYLLENEHYMFVRLFIFLAGHF